MGYRHASSGSKRPQRAMRPRSTRLRFPEPTVSAISGADDSKGRAVFCEGSVLLCSDARKRCGSSRRAPSSSRSWDSRRGGVDDSDLRGADLARVTTGRRDAGKRRHAAIDKSTARYRGSLRRGAPTSFDRMRDGTRPEALGAWYAEHLGVAVDPAFGGATFEGAGQAGPTVWSPFAADSQHFQTHS